jgi:hypothetical protein
LTELSKKNNNISYTNNPSILGNKLDKNKLGRFGKIDIIKRVEVTGG